MLIRRKEMAIFLALAVGLAGVVQLPAFGLSKGHEEAKNTPVARAEMEINLAPELLDIADPIVSGNLMPVYLSRPSIQYMQAQAWPLYMEESNLEMVVGDAPVDTVQVIDEQEISVELIELKKGESTAQKLIDMSPEIQEDAEQYSPSADKKKNFIDWLDPWKKTLELSYVVTGGNTLSSSFSFGANLTRSPNEKDTYTMKTFLLRSHSTTITRRAVGTEENFTVEEERTRRLSAENYLLSGQYDHRVSGRLTTNLAFVWDRNKFSGVLSRALWTAGAGLVMADSARTKMRTQAGLSFTIRKYSQQPVNTFLGFRYTLSWEQKLFDNASFATAFIFDDNLAHLGDWRYEWNFNVAAPLSKKLSLKTGVRILRNNRPPDLSVPLFTPEGAETGTTVLIPRGKVDTFFTTSFVLNF